MSKSKKNPMYLKASERPLFAPVTSVHRTKIDKANSRQNIKKETKSILRALGD